ncbi:MAG: cytochrome c [Bacteroidetes bacterium]|nr:cytochrome c [Bacteroidota bacterium]
MKMHINRLVIIFISIFTSLLFLISCGGDSKSTTTAVSEEPTAEIVESDAVSDEMNLSAGKEIYNGKGNCFTCHMENGQGLPPSFPPLANADYLLADIPRAISQAINGSQEPILVNGISYPGNIMSAGIKGFELTDQEVVDVVNYVLNSWGNNGGFIELADVEAARSLHVD